MEVFKLYVAFLFALTGAVMGSFLNCWAMRYAKGERWPRGRSRCPRCGHTLGPLELIPVVSWLCQRGHCRSCREKISVRYPLTELTGAFLFTAAFLRFGLTAYTAELVALFSVLMLLAFIDYDTMLLPGAPMLAALALWLAFLPAHPDWQRRALEGALTALALGAALLAVSLVMDRVLKRDSLGGGDIKLLALTALYLGPVPSLLCVILSCLLGLLFALAFKSPGKTAADGETAETGGKDETGESGETGETAGKSETGESAETGAFPFGPAIALSAALTLLFASPLVEWYMGLL